VLEYYRLSQRKSIWRTIMAFEYVDDAVRQFSARHPGERLVVKTSPCQDGAVTLNASFNGAPVGGWPITVLPSLTLHEDVLAILEGLWKDRLPTA
jgi:hypothetical protein